MILIGLHENRICLLLIEELKAVVAATTLTNVVNLAVSIFTVSLDQQDIKLFWSQIQPFSHISLNLRTITQH